MNCGLSPCDADDDECTAKKQADLCVEIPEWDTGSYSPWGGPDGARLTFKYRWCKAKHRMWKAPVTEPGFREDKFVYHRKGKKNGIFLGDDHLNWLTPGCSWTTNDMHNCTKTVFMNTEHYANLEKEWFALEGHKCKALSVSECREDCAEFCQSACDCAWGKDAASRFMRDGIVMRWQRAEDSPEWTCHESFSFDKTCLCKNGTAAVGESCPQHNKHFCQDCDAGFYLDGESRRCLENMCTCTNGRGAVGLPGCNTNGTHSCVSCFDDQGVFLPEGSAICQEKKCLCDNGAAAVGTACSKHNDHVCTPSCFTGYHYVSASKRCLNNTCLCENGTAVRDFCPEHNEHFCQDCDAGFYLDRESRRCVENMCTCTNGRGAVGLPGCTTNGTHSCASCNDDQGVFLPEGSAICQEKKCLCDNGDAAVGTACSKHGDYMCTPSCPTGYHYGAAHKRCRSNTCLCENGRAAVRDSCPEHNEHFCQNCNAGFYLDRESRRCVEKECLCDNGAAVVGTACPKHGDNVCTPSCFTGYHYVAASKKCQRNMCTCTNGRGAVGLPGCTTNGTHSCVSCNDDQGVFLPEGSAICQEKECLCDNGVAAVGLACSEHGDYVCTPSCFTGYHYVAASKRCLKNVCTCSNGVRSEERNCPVHGSEHCDSCGPFSTRLPKNACSGPCVALEISNLAFVGGDINIDDGKFFSWLFDAFDAYKVDAYCIMTLGGVAEETTTKDNNVRPNWGTEKWVVLPKDGVVDREELTITCKDEDPVLEDNIIGTATVPIDRRSKVNHTMKFPRGHTHLNFETACLPGSEATLIMANAECNSEDVHLGVTSSFEACAQKCLDTPGCEFLIYGKTSKKGRCYWEKTRSGNCEEGWEDDEYDFFRVKKNGCPLEHGWDYNGYDLENGESAADSWRGCAIKCDKRDDCAFWTWVGGNEKRCYLKSSAEGRVLNTELYLSGRKCFTAGASFAQLRPSFRSLTNSSATWLLATRNGEAE